MLRVMLTLGCAAVGLVLGLMGGLAVATCHMAAHGWLYGNKDVCGTLLLLPYEIGGAALGLARGARLGRLLGKRLIRSAEPAQCEPESV